MEYLFDSDKRKIVQQLRLAPHVFLMLDYDGTLAPIVPEPNLAKISLSVCQTLVKLSENPKFSVAIITGRTVQEMEKFLRLKGLIYAGNHGLELQGPDFKYTHAKAKESARIMSEFKKELDLLQKKFTGSLLEDKHLSLSFHYRRLDDINVLSLQKEFEKIAAPWIESRRIQIQDAKKVWEIRPHLNWNKGSAVRWILLHEDPASLPIYIGDDQPDEPAFKALKNRGITLRVGYEKNSHASYFVNNVYEVEQFLAFVERGCPHHKK